MWGVIHGVRLFTPMMLDAAAKDPDWQGHIVNTASMAGLLKSPKKCSTPWWPTSFISSAIRKPWGNVQSRMECILQQANPADPFAERPEIGRDLKAALRSG